MSDSISMQSLSASPGRFMLLREEAEQHVVDHEAQMPRVRRYHLSRMGGRPARSAINPGPRQPGDFSHLRRPHD